MSELERWDIRDNAIAIVPQTEWFLSGYQAASLKYTEYGPAVPPPDAMYAWEGRAGMIFDYRNALNEFADVSCARYIVVDVQQDWYLPGGAYVSLSMRLHDNEDDREGTLYESDLFALDFGVQRFNFDMESSEIWWVGSSRGESIDASKRALVSEIIFYVYWHQVGKKYEKENFKISNKK